MPDELYLSIWVRGFRAEDVLRRFEGLLRVFPFSRLRPGISVLRIYALEYSEPPLVEHAFAGETDLESVMALAKEFENADCAYRAEGWWDLFEFRNGWQLAPARVALTCFGPLFENDEHDHLRIEFASEADFLPPPHAPEGARMVQSNLKSLVRLAHEIEESLPVERRKLWAESGENFAERLDEKMLP